MKISPQNANNLSSNTSFTASIVPNAGELRIAKRFANCALDNLEKKLVSSINEKAPHLLQKTDGEFYIPDDSIKRKAVSGLKTFFGMPVDVIDSIAKKFPNSSLNNAEFLQKYRESVQLEEEIRALHGIHKNSLKFLKESMPEGGKYPTDECNDYCHSICDPITEKFNKKLNDSMAVSVADYDTKKERFGTRLISGFTAAIFLGTDFFNKAIQKGKSKEEAKKEQHMKQGQEIKENVCEAITQFAVFATCSKLVNSSVWAPAIISAGIGFVSRIISRLSSHMPIFRIDVPETNKGKDTPTSVLSAPLLSMGEFAQSAKNGNVKEFLDTKLQTQTLNINPAVPEKAENNTNKKKPLLGAKNILLFCVLSIAGGFSLKGIKNNTKIGEYFADIMQKHSDKFDAKAIEEVVASKESLLKLVEILKSSGEEHLGNSIAKSAIKTNKGKAQISLGKDYKTTKLLGIEVRVKDLKRLKTAPFRFVKELVSYPYKMANKLAEAIKNSNLKKQGKEIPKTPPKATDTYNIKNLYKRFLEYEAKYGNDEAKLTEEFGKYVRKMRLMSNNEVTSSKGDNSKIAVLAQTLGTLTGIWFNMNDEFNSSVRTGATKEEAEKEARLRGINKFFRMTVQVIISGSLNDIFQKQYNSSIAKSAAVVAASTVLTDAASRVLTGMPSTKMTKEELDNYQKRHKEGIMSWYYNLIDKLAS